jgi:hypothetical protein
MTFPSVVFMPLSVFQEMGSFRVTKKSYRGRGSPEGKCPELVLKYPHSVFITLLFSNPIFAPREIRFHLQSKVASGRTVILVVSERSKDNKKLRSYFFLNNYPKAPFKNVSGPARLEVLRSRQNRSCLGRLVPVGGAGYKERE